MSKIKTSLLILVAVILVSFGAYLYINSEQPLAGRTSNVWKRVSANIVYNRGSASVGSDTTSSTNDFMVEETIRLVPSGTATTTCDTGRPGAIMYSTGTAALYYCNGSAWALFSTP